MKILCYTCLHILGSRCKLYDIPILHDSRFCDGYKIKVNNKVKKTTEGMIGPGEVKYDELGFIIEEEEEKE